MTYGIDNASGLDLASWGKILGFNPWHLMQIGDPASTGGLKISSDCSTLTYERDSNNAQRVGRATIRRAIEDAEQQIHRYTFAWPTPRYGSVEFLPSQMRRVGWDLFLQTYDAPILELGTPTNSTPVQAAVVYSDADGDGYFETATITASVPADVTANNVIVRFLAADCAGFVPNIPPRTITINSTTNIATIVIDTWNMAKPKATAGWAVYNGTSGMLNVNDMPPSASSPFVTDVEVFCRTTDPTAAVSISYRQCCGASEEITTTHHASVAHHESGWIRLCVPYQWCELPDRVVINYLSGRAREDGQMAQPWQTLVTRLAAANLTNDICGCKTANRELAYWQFEMNRTEGTSEAYSPPADLTNKLGQRRGHIDVWRQLVDAQRLRAVRAG